MKPINLRNRYGKKYRIDHDPAADCEPNGKEDPWLMLIPCAREGNIFPYSNTKLAVMVTTKQRVNRLKRLGFKISQEGDTEAIFLFAPSQFDEIAKTAKPIHCHKISRKCADKAVSVQFQG